MNEVFISYSRADEKWLRLLLTFLKPVLRSQPEAIWWDGKIKPGQEWRKEINEALASARVGVLLVSYNFLDSDFINDEELPYLLDALRKRRVKLLAVLLTNCLYGETPLRDIQFAHPVSKPLADLRGGHLHDAFVKICQQIAAEINARSTGTLIEQYLKDKEIEWRRPRCYGPLWTTQEKRRIDIQQSFYHLSLRSETVQSASPDSIVRPGLRALILAGPGGGKTLILNYFAFHYAQLYRSVTANAYSPVPILIHLPDRWPKDHETGPALIATMIEAELGANTDTLSCRHHFLFLFDGLDELRAFGVSLSAVISDIAAFLRIRDSRNVVIVTCRTQAAELDDIIPPNWESFHIKSLDSRREQGRFLRKVFGARESGFILKKLAGSLPCQGPRATRIEGNPLLLTKLGILVLARAPLQELALCPAIVSMDCMRVLLESRGRGADRLSPNRYTADQKLRFLTFAALELLAGGGRELLELMRSKEAKAIFGDALSPQELYDELTVRSGVLSCDGSFQHASDAESLAALAIFNHLAERREHWRQASPDALEPYLVRIDLRRHFEVRELVCRRIEMLDEDGIVSVARTLCAAVGHAAPPVVHNCAEILAGLDPSVVAPILINVICSDCGKHISYAHIPIVWLLGEVRGGNSIELKRSAANSLAELLQGAALGDRNMECLTVAYHGAWALEKIYASIAEVPVEQLPYSQGGIGLLETAPAFDSVGSIEEVMRNPDLLSAKPWMIAFLRSFRRLDPPTKVQTARWLVPMPFREGADRSSVDFDSTCTLRYNSCWLLGQLLNCDWYGDFAPHDPNHVHTWDRDCELRREAVDVLWRVFVENERRERPDGNLAGGVVEAMGKIGTWEACDHLLDVLSPDWMLCYRCRFRAAEGLRKIARRYIEEIPVLERPQAILKRIAVKLEEARKYFRHRRFQEEAERTLLLLREANE